MSKIKSILFNTDMVRALLAGSKTVTRRVVKPQPEITPIPTFGGSYRVSMKENVFVKPPYRPGDILYVRETFSKERVRGEDIFVYKTGDENAKILQEVGGRIIKWHPSIHMPREAARIFLRVTDVRVERLQEISEKSAMQEGCVPLIKSARFVFGDLWDSTIKKADRSLYGWEANPWVWVVEFERCEKPEEGQVHEQ